MEWTSRHTTVCASLALLAACVMIMTGAAIAQVAVNGDFSAQMVGYGDDAEGDGEHPNKITMEGEMVIEGENAVEPTISINSGPSTVLDTSSVEVLVSGDQSVEFETWNGPNTVQLSTDEIPAGTTVTVSADTYFMGGTDNDEIEAGSVTIEYESPGGTPGEETFVAEADASNSPDNVIGSLERGDSIETWQKWFSYIGVAAVIIFVVFIILKLLSDDEPPGPQIN